MRETIVQRPTWWKRRTRLEKLLLLLLILLFLIGLAFLVALICVSKQAQEGHTCTSHSCVKTASQILDRLNVDVDPCDDFYDFACGNFIKNTVIPSDKTSGSAFSQLNDQVLQQLRNVLDAHPQDTEPRSFSITKKFYGICLNESYIEDQGLFPMKNILQQLGGWPVIEGDTWNEGSFNWKILMYKMKSIGLETNQLLTFDISVDSKNNSRYLLHLLQASLDLTREILIKDLDDKVLRAYYEFMVNVAMYFGAYRSFAEKEMLEALEFERKLANISLPPEERRNASKMYNPMTIDELQKKFPSIPWLQYINNILYPTLQVNKNELIIVQAPSFIEKLERLLRETPKRTIANLVLWISIKDSISALPDQLRKYQLKFKSIAYGVLEDPPRWQHCIKQTYTRFSLVIGALYIRKYFKPESKTKALEMVEDIQKSFYNILHNIDWMDEKTKNTAIEKAKTMDIHIAYPDELLDDAKLDNFYQKLQINDSLLESELLWSQFSWDLTWTYLRKPVNKTEWITHGSAATVNAFYAFNENSISFPAGILQDIFFSSDRPNYINYGAIGSIIGHEITHGFDDQGRQYDQNGMVVNWWTPETEKAFLVKAQCIIDQYNNFVVPEINETLNGINTQGENIADNGGFKEAYLAYENWQSRNGDEPQLPGLPYNSRQMFWISAAGTWCSVDRNDYLRIQVSSDVHSPSRFRVIGPLSNLAEFSKDFNCPKTSKMNPEKKCQVW